MKAIILTGIFSFVSVLSSSGILLAGNVLTKTARGLKLNIEEDKLVTEIVFYTPEIARVVKYPSSSDTIPERNNLSVVLAPHKCNLSYGEAGGKYTVTSSEVMVLLDKETGNVSFQTKNGAVLLEEQEKPVLIQYKEGVNTGDYRIKQVFKLDKDEPIYGLGQMQSGKLSQRNQDKYLIQGNVEDVVTFFQSVKGYGVFWDNYSPTWFVDNEKATFFESEVGEFIDYYFMTGGNADGVIANMRELTGQVPMLPLWTYGFWQSRERYKSQNEIVGVVSKYRELQVPLDGIIQDWQYWGGNYLWNAMEFLNGEFWNPQKMMEDIHAMNAKAIISIWSSFGPMTKPYKELDEKGMLFNFQTWPLAGPDLWPPREDYLSGVRVYDAYNPKARDIYWKYANKGLFALGMDGWWMDSTEPDHLNFKDEDLNEETFLGSFRKVRNAYPLMSVGGVYDHQRKASSDKRVFILTRSAFAGQQRYGANTWTGDIQGTWDSFKRQIPAGLNFSLSAIPNWNTDIGGFFLGEYPKKLADPDYKELYVRWLEFGTFCPMMRSHGADAPREIYQFGQKGEPYYDAIEKFIHLRYSLLPYIYSLSWEVTSRQSTFLRALVMDFPKDKNVWDMNNEYMFGKSILVKPVTDPMYTRMQDEERVSDFSSVKSTEVYLPEGADWYDYWTEEKLAGGVSVQKEVPLDVMPLYVKAGSIIPIGPEVQYARQKSWQQLDIHVYPGADGTFCLYEDEFDNYNYEKGAYSEIWMKWNDKKRTFTIESRKGEYQGMLHERTFVLKTADGKEKTINYTGKKINIKL